MADCLNCIWCKDATDEKYASRGKTYDCLKRNKPITIGLLKIECQYFTPRDKKRVVQRKTEKQDKVEEKLIKKDEKIIIDESKLSQEMHRRIQLRCHKRVSRMCKRKGIPFDRDEYLRCVEIESATEIQKLHAPPVEKKVSKSEIQQYREKLAQAREDDEGDIYSEFEKIFDTRDHVAEEARKEEFERIAKEEGFEVHDSSFKGVLRRLIGRREGGE